MSLLINWPGMPVEKQVEMGDSLRKSLLYLPPPPMFTDRLQLDKFQILQDLPTVHLTDVKHLSNDGVIVDMDISYAGNTNIQLNTHVHGNACAYTESGHPCALSATRAMRFGFAGKILSVPLAATLLHVAIDARLRVFLSERTSFVAFHRFVVRYSLITSIDSLEDRRGEIDDMLRTAVREQGLAAARGHMTVSMDGLRAEMGGSADGEVVAEEAAEEDAKKEEEEEEVEFPPRAILLDENVVLPQDEFAADMYNENVELLFVREGMHRGAHSSGGKAHVHVESSPVPMACKTLDDDDQADDFGGPSRRRGHDHDHDDDDRSDTYSTASSDFGASVLLGVARDDRP